MSLRAYITKTAELGRGLRVLFQRGIIKYESIPRLGRRNIFRVEKGGTLELNGRLQTCRDVEIVVYNNGHLVVGDDVYIGHGSTIACATLIVIGAHTMIGDLVTIRDLNHRRTSGIPLSRCGIEADPISIGSNCWLGSKVTVVGGASIGNEVTVAANAVVTRQFGNDLVVGGVPATIMKETETDPKA